MIPARNHRALYAAFDRFPSRKGSAVHIDRFARALFEQAQGGLLYVLGGDDLPAYQRENNVEIVRYMRPAEHVLERAAGYGQRLDQLLHDLPALELVHFRDPWSGIPLIENKRYTTVYEVNGLPSIELPYLYPAIPPAVLDHVRALEQRCLDQADVIIAPSRVTAERVGGIHVPNGADIPEPTERPLDGRYLLYFGALQPWQGVDTALRAFSRLKDLEDLELVICSSTHPRRAKPYRKLAEKLEIEPRWHFQLSERELAPWREHATLSLAPLRDCARNAQQGCAPLKILESHASGTPVVASDLPATRELIDATTGILVAPDRPGELARAIRVALDYPDRLAELGRNARARVNTWDQSIAQLQALYAAHGLAMEAMA